MDGFTDYVLVAGPCCGASVTFPDGFPNEQIEIWCHPTKGVPLFAKYERDGLRYRYRGWSFASDGADWQDDAHPKRFAELDGRSLTVWQMVSSKPKGV